MPLFYFDIDDGERFTRDEQGLDCPDRKAARDYAIGVLPDLAREALPDGDRHEIVVTVRDESGRNVFRAVLSLVAEWLDAGQEGRLPE
jgi:hypothetical protein